MWIEQNVLAVNLPSDLGVSWRSLPSDAHGMLFNVMTICGSLKCCSGGHTFMTPPGPNC
jgi:hypothetical protein